MKILHSLVFFLPEKIGGIEIYVLELARFQQKYGNEVVVTIPVWPNSSTADDYTQDSIRVRTYVERENMSRKEFQGLIPSSNLQSYKKILTEEKPDIVHFHQLTSSNGITLFHLEIAKKIGAKVIFTAHLAGMTCYTKDLIYKQKTLCNGKIDLIKCTACVLQRQGITNKLLSKFIIGLNIRLVGKPWSLYNLFGGRFTYLSISEFILHKKQRLNNLFILADAVITLSEWYQNVLKSNEKLIQKIYLVKQGFVNGEKLLETLPYYNGDRPLKILFLGRIFPEKGLHILLEAIKVFNNDDLHLSIYGQFDFDEYYFNCRKAADNLNNVSWYEPIPSSMVLRTMQQHDVLCIPSTIAEMAPIVLQEARSVGLVIIGTDIGGIKDEIINNITGWLFPLNNVLALQKIINNLIEYPKLIKEIIENQTTVRSFEQVMIEVNAIYDKVLK